jgi:hypothetical protein
VTPSWPTHTPTYSESLSFLVPRRVQAGHSPSRLTRAATATTAADGKETRGPGLMCAVTCRRRARGGRCKAGSLIAAHAHTPCKAYTHRHTQTHTLQGRPKAGKEFRIIGSAGRLPNRKEVPAGSLMASPSCVCTASCVW